MHQRRLASRYHATVYSIFNDSLQHVGTFLVFISRCNVCIIDLWPPGLESTGRDLNETM